MNKLKILSLDQATKSGYSVADNGEIVGYGLISSEEEDFDHVIADIKNQVIGLINAYEPEMIGIEEVHHAFSVETTKKLSRLQGVLINYFIENDLLYVVVKPSQWQSNEGFKGKNKKKQALDKARELFNDDTITSDTADSIFIGKYVIDKIKVNIEEEEK